MNASYRDKILQCRDCGASFTWTGGEQEFYAAKGLLNQPARCSTCRQAARAFRQGRPARAAGPRELFPAVCHRCGIQTKVPFLPRTERPVYCSACFEVVRGEQASSSVR